MVGKNSRINVTFEGEIAKLLSSIAFQEDKSVSGLVRELALEALELREDIYLSRIAEKNDVKSAKRHNHDDAWK